MCNSFILDLFSKFDFCNSNFLPRLVAEFDLANFDIIEFELAKFEPAKFEHPKFGPTKFELTKFDLAKLELAKLELAKFDLAKPKHECSFPNNNWQKRLTIVTKQHRKDDKDCGQSFWAKLTNRQKSPEMSVAKKPRKKHLLAKKREVSTHVINFTQTLCHRYLR
jgi:hypothetical protein